MELDALREEAAGDPIKAYALLLGVAGLLPDKIASNNRQFAPSKQIPTKTTAAADEPKWDDSLDEQFTRVGWQMLCIQQNQSFRTDAFGIVEYQLQQFSQAIQADKL